MNDDVMMLGVASAILIRSSAGQTLRARDDGTGIVVFL